MAHAPTASTVPLPGLGLEPGTSISLDHTRPATDTKSYRYVVLPNRVRALLVSEAPASAAPDATPDTAAGESEAKGGWAEGKGGEAPAGGGGDDGGSGDYVDVDSDGDSGDDDEQVEGLTRGMSRLRAASPAVPRSDASGSSAGGGSSSKSLGRRVVSFSRSDGGSGRSGASAGAGSGGGGDVDTSGTGEGAVAGLGMGGVTEFHEEPLPPDDASLDSQSLASDSEGPDGGAGGPAGGAKPQRDQKAAVAVAVGIGSFSDPPKLGGLAHFLEHMLFMGSTKYPSENEYDSYLSDHGGYSNAFTECEYTCFHFDVNPEHLQPAMDRLAHFFVSPLLREEAAAREVRSVNSEFDQARTSDSARIDAVRAQLCRAGHPNGKFGWGNAKSLEEDPVELGINVREELLAFHKRFYSSNTMAVTVRGRETLDELQALVTDTFGAVQDRDASMPTFETEGPPLDPAALPRLVRVAPVKDTHVLNLIWCLPPLQHQYKSKPDDYLAHLIGHEARGSILYLLKERGLATGLTAGVSDGGEENSSAAALFQVSISLSEAGLADWVSVGVVVFQFLAILRYISHPPQWVHQEVAKMAHQRYHYGDDEEPGDQVVRLAADMVNGVIKPEDLLIASALHEETFQPQQVCDLVALMDVDRVHVELVSSTLTDAEDLDQTEPWFGAKYGVQPLPADVVAAWTNPSSSPGLGLPRPNPFVPTQLKVHPLTLTLPPALQLVADDPSGGPVCPDLSAPARILHGREGKLWWHQDRIFKLPRANVHFRLYCPRARPTGRCSGLTALYLAVVNDSLNETAYHAYLAELDYGLNHDRFGIQISFSGFTEKMARLAEAVFTRLASGTVTDDRFARVKEQVLRGLHNRLISVTANVAYQRLTCLCSKSVSHHDTVAAVEACTADDLRAHAKQLFHGAFTECFVHGNFTPEGALAMFSLTRTLVPPASLATARGAVADDPWGDIAAERAVAAARAADGGGSGRSRSASSGRGSLLQPMSPLLPRDNGERHAMRRVATPRGGSRRFSLGSVEGGASAAGKAQTTPFSSPSQRYGSSRSSTSTNTAASGGTAGGNGGGGGGVGPGSVRLDASGADGFVYPDDPVIRLRRNTVVMREVRAAKDDDVNSAVEVYYQLGRECLELLAGTDLLEHIMSEPAYDVLRTKEQLGYTVRTAAKLTGCVVGFAITVQSAEYTCEHVYSRIEAFLAGFRKKLVAMPQRKFAQHVAQLVTAKLTPDAALSDQSDRWWAEIESRRYDFRAREREAAALRSMTRGQLLNLFDAAFSGARRRVLLCYVHRAVAAPAEAHRQRLSSTGTAASASGVSTATDDTDDAHRASHPRRVRRTHSGGSMLDDSDSDGDGPRGVGHSHGACEIVAKAGGKTAEGDGGDGSVGAGAGAGTGAAGSGRHRPVKIVPAPRPRTRSDDGAGAGGGGGDDTGTGDGSSPAGRAGRVRRRHRARAADEEDDAATDTDASSTSSGSDTDDAGGGGAGDGAGAGGGLRVAVAAPGPAQAPVVEVVRVPDDGIKAFRDQLGYFALLR